MQHTQEQRDAWTDRITRGLVRRWAGLLTLVLGVYAGLPLLSPLLRSWGFDRAGRAIFVLYSQVCHQFADRSFFLAGYQVCYCHRCTALYSSLFAMSALYSIGRWRRSIDRRWALLLTLPMVIDGMWHLIADVLPNLALRSTENAPGSLNFWLRIVTGVLFGVGIVLWAYPRAQRELGEV